MTKIKVKDLKYYENEIISIDTYFSQFHNFPKGSFKKTTHKDIKTNFSFIETKRLENITREEILTGEVLLVKDCEGIVIPYINPFKYQNIDNYLDSVKENAKVEIIFTVEDDIDELDISEEDIENLSSYELKKLLQICKRSHQHKSFRMVQKALYFDKENHSTIKEKQEKIRKREIRKEDLL